MDELQKIIDLQQEEIRNLTEAINVINDELQKNRDILKTLCEYIIDLYNDKLRS